LALRSHYERCGILQRPKANTVVWGFFHHWTGVDRNNNPLSYKVDVADGYQYSYFKLRYIHNNKDTIKYFYGETAWMDINRFINDLGDSSFNVDNIWDDMLDSYISALAISRGDC
jgi:hypothetical protein